MITRTDAGFSAVTVTEMTADVVSESIDMSVPMREVSLDVELSESSRIVGPPPKPEDVG